MRSLSGPAVVVGSLVWIPLPFLIFLKTCDAIQLKKKCIYTVSTLGPEWAQHVILNTKFRKAELNGKVCLDSTTLREKRASFVPAVYSENPEPRQDIHSPGSHFYHFDLSGFPYPSETCTHACTCLHTYEAQGENALGVQKGKVSRAVVNTNAFKCSSSLMGLPGVSIQSTRSSHSF